MALTNVAHWTKEGWKSITIEEATKIYPSTISVHSGIFMCRLCKKYITLTAPGRNARCFKHSRGDIEKECEDRNLSAPIKQFELHEFIPPIRINIHNKNLLSFEMGFIIPPGISTSDGTIEIITENSPNNIFKYNISRLSGDRLTYLKIGTVPSEKYIINIGDSLLSLPHIIDGIKKSGVLFDYNTRKKLPDDADVIVDHEYIYLSSKRLWSAPDTVISEICSIKDWYVYKIKAMTFNRKTADFFLKLGYLLTEKKSSLNFLWPEYVVTPYIIKHEEAIINLYIQGESITPKICPEVSNLNYQYCDSDNGVAVTVKCNGRQQLLSAGRTKVLRYTYLWKERLYSTQKETHVSITNIKGEQEISGIKKKLPEKKILQVSSEFDGFIEIKKDNWTIEKRQLKANMISEIDQLQYGLTVSVFQGLECVWSVSYVKEKDIGYNSENELLQALQNAGGKMIPISHLFGVTVDEYKNYPLVQKWIYAQIRNGVISEKAYKIIRGK